MEDVETGGEPDVAELETIGDDPSSDIDPTPPDLWLLGADVIGGGGGADDDPEEPVPYRFDRLFMVMAELWFQYADGGAPKSDCWCANEAWM